MPEKDLEGEWIAKEDEQAHEVRYGSVQAGVFRTRCGIIMHTPIEVGDRLDFDETCEDCHVLQIDSDNIGNPNPDDRRTKQMTWPRNTDLDKR